MQEMPLVSICTLNYNHENYVNDYIEGLMNQTYRNMELIIMDDCSTDDSGKILSRNIPLLEKKFNRVIYIENKVNTGIKQLSKNIDTLVRIGQGKYIKVFSSDDIMMSNMIEREVGFLENNPECGLCHAKIINVDNNFKLGQLWDSKKGLPDVKMAAKGKGIYEEMLDHYAIYAQTAMFRKDIFDKLGGFDCNIAIEDKDFWLRISKISEIGFINEPLAFYRKADTSISNFTVGSRKQRKERIHFGYIEETKMWRKHLKNVSRKKAEIVIIKHYQKYLYKSLVAGLPKDALYFKRKLEARGIKLTKDQKRMLVCAIVGLPMKS